IGYGLLIGWLRLHFVEAGRRDEAQPTRGTMKKNKSKKPAAPEAREQRALGGSRVRLAARPGAVYGQLRRDNKRIQKLLVSAVDAAEIEKAHKAGKGDSLADIAERLLGAWALEVETAKPSDGS